MVRGRNHRAKRMPPTHFTAGRRLKYINKKESIVRNFSVANQPSRHAGRAGHGDRSYEPPEGVDAEALPRRQLARHLVRHGAVDEHGVGLDTAQGVVDGQQALTLAVGHFRALAEMPPLPADDVVERVEDGSDRVVAEVGLLDALEHGVSDDERAETGHGVGDAGLGLALDGHVDLARTRCQRADDEAEEQGYRDCDGDLGQRLDADVVVVSFHSSMFSAGNEKTALASREPSSGRS